MRRRSSTRRITISSIKDSADAEPINNGRYVYKVKQVQSGSCLCGAIEYSVDDPMSFAVNCCCRFCRKAHGASFVTLAFVPLGQLSITQGKELLAEFDIPKLGAQRCFCSNCGTRLFNVARGAGMASIITATLDKGLDIVPLANINTESLSVDALPDNGLPNYKSAPSAVELQGLLK